MLGETDLRMYGPKVYPMLGFADLPVQRSLYHILRKSIHARTASLVVEIATEASSAESETLAQLPSVLIGLAGQARDESVSLFFKSEGAESHPSLRTGWSVSDKSGKSFGMASDI
jgi:hypothetical protein